jgi:hypothetical protein
MRAGVGSRQKTSTLDVLSGTVIPKKVQERTRPQFLSSFSPPEDLSNHKQPMYEFALRETKTHLVEHL